MKTVIMAGGKGTRVSEIAKDIPKPMIPIAGKPVLEHQLEVLKKQGISQVTIVVGYLGEKIIDYFQNGVRWGIEIRYIIEEAPLGNAGALSYLRECGEDVLLINGDIVFDIDISFFYRYHAKKEAGITLLTHPNSHPYDSTLIVADESGKVIRNIKKEEEREDYKNRINAGMYIISPSVLKKLPSVAAVLDMDKDIVQSEIANEIVYAYDTTEYIKDMGTPERYRQVESDLKKGLVQKKNRINKQKAIFLDRDGTINKHKKYINKKEQMELLPEAAETIRMINQSEYLAIIVTNQPVIARGECTWEELNAIHNRLDRLLGEQGAYVDDIYICPHHPDKGFEGEVPEYKIDCECRKPKPGLLYRAAKEHNIDLTTSYMIGDTIRDFQAGEQAGCKSILVPEGLKVDIIRGIL